MSTFFMFWIYAAPAARMAALQGLRFIGIATHDSIGIGEDGECGVSDSCS
jgi:dihydroxyacetone synthase